MPDRQPHPHDTDRRGNPPSRRSLRISWSGDSLVASYAAHNPRLLDQLDLPPIGSRVEVTEWRHRGYPHTVVTALRARLPHIDIEAVNSAIPGVTSADVAAAIGAADPAPAADLAVLGCGINDVWRWAERHPEAGDIEAYSANLRSALELLTARAGVVLVLGSPPVGRFPTAETAAVNRELVRYNEAAQAVAYEAGADFLGVQERFAATAESLGLPADTRATSPAAVTLWQRDGVHLSDLGNQLMAEEILRYLAARSPEWAPAGY